MFLHNQAYGRGAWLDRFNVKEKQGQGHWFGGWRSKESSDCWVEANRGVDIDVNVKEGVYWDSEVDVTCERLNGQKALMVLKKYAMDINFSSNLQKQLLESKKESCNSEEFEDLNQATCHRAKEVFEEINQATCHKDEEVSNKSKDINGSLEFLNSGRAHNEVQGAELLFGLLVEPRPNQLWWCLFES